MKNDGSSQGIYVSIIVSGMKIYITVWTDYSMVIFPWINHIRHLIGHPCQWDTACLCEFKWWGITRGLFTHAQSSCGMETGRFWDSFSVTVVMFTQAQMVGFEADAENWMLNTFLVGQVLLPLGLHSMTKKVCTYAMYLYSLSNKTYIQKHWETPGRLRSINLNMINHFLPANYRSANFWKWGKFWVLS